MKAQATTIKRSAITVEQQFRWHHTYEQALNLLRARNTGVCKETGKTFGEVIHHFIIGGDETGMSGSDGNVEIVGSVEKKKHEATNMDSRVSITMYRTGSVAGSNGPTAFLLSGVNKRKHFDDAFLKKYGAAEGSTIAMTDSAYMTEESWIKLTPSLCKGIRSMPIIVKNPQWWALEILDGFGPHVSSLEAMEIREKNKILCLKEEGDSSHVNQAYDKFVACHDKKLKRELLCTLRNSPAINKGVLDQYGLLHTGLICVRETTPATWTNSFQACNLDPRTRLSFPLWCKKIEHF